MRRSKNGFGIRNDKVIQFLGGIDIVVDVALNAPSYSLDSEDAIALKKYLEQPPLPSRSTILDETGAAGSSHILKYSLYPENNMLYQLSPFVHRHLFSKEVVITLVVLYVGGATLYCLLILTDSDSDLLTEFRVIGTVFYVFTAIPCEIAALLRVNRSMIPKIAKTGDFWIITGTWVMTSIYFGVDLFVFNTSGSLAVDILYFCFMLIAAGLALVVVCCFDGIDGLSPNLKMLATTVFAFFSAVAYIGYNFVIEDRTVHINQLGEYGRISITANLASSGYVLFLFFGKMAVKSWWKGKKRAILVKYSPFIEWK